MTAKVFEKEGKIYISGHAVSEKDVGEARLLKFNQYAVNQAYIYRHEHPEANPKASVMGRVVRSEITGEKPNRYQDITVELFNETKDHKTFIDYLKTSIAADKPIGFSPGWEQFNKGDDEMNPTELQPYEYSGTPIPYCDSCRVSKVITMEDKEKKEYEAKLSELQHALDEAVGKKKKFEDDVKAVRDEYENKVKTMADDLVKTNKAFEKMREDFRIATEIEPIVQKIFSFEKREELLPYYRGLDVKKLNEIYEREAKKQRPTVQTETMAESQARAMEGVDRDAMIRKFREFADNVEKRMVGK